MISYLTQKDPIYYIIVDKEGPIYDILINTKGLYLVYQGWQKGTPYAIS